MNMENLYFIAIVLPDPVRSQVIDIQVDIANRFNSKKALKVMPHVTLKAPVKIVASERLKVMEWFEKLILDTSSFDLELHNFGAFPNPNHPVIYVKPIANGFLMSLQNKLLRSFQSTFPDIRIMNLELSFKPHVTVAYRDLDPAMFHKAWPEFIYSNFNATFNVSEIHLLQHDGNHWNIIQTRNLL